MFLQGCVELVGLKSTIELVAMTLKSGLVVVILKVEHSGLNALI